MSFTALKEKVARECEKHLTLAKRLYSIKQPLRLGKEIEIKFSGLLTRCLARCFIGWGIKQAYFYYFLTFSAHALRRDPDGVLTQVVPHEIAHIINHLVYRGFGHDDNWRKIMKDFGIPNARAYLSLNIFYNYRCPNGHLQKLTYRQHKKMQPNPLTYICSRGCTGELIYDGDSNNSTTE